MINDLTHLRTYLLANKHVFHLATISKQLKYSSLLSKFVREELSKSEIEINAQKFLDFFTNIAFTGSTSKELREYLIKNSTIFNLSKISVLEFEQQNNFLSNFAFKTYKGKDGSLGEKEEKVIKFFTSLNYKTEQQYDQIC
jgi:chromatin segregation and condensation protein Rec8/ScpA/Scc1 (kleisin family)